MKTEGWDDHAMRLNAAGAGREMTRCYRSREGTRE
jgi:hypothetical protein